MNVLHIINNLGSGGAEKLIEDSAIIMNNCEGITAGVLLLTDDNNVFDKKLMENGVRLDVIPLRKMRSILNIFYIRSYILKGNYDIVHAHLFPAFYWTSLASKLIFRDKPILVTTEHNTSNRRMNKAYLRGLEKYIYSSYKKVISISEKTQENLLAWLGLKHIKNDKFVIIDNGIDVNRFSEAKPYPIAQISSEFTENTKLICMVGRFSEQKDQGTLIKAIKSLPEDVHLLLIGEGKLKEKNINFSKEIGVGNRVHFLGFRDDVERIYKTCDVVVLSSNWEGFGLAAAEGMAAGKPVIGTNVDGLREVINDQELLFKTGDSEELAAKITCLLNDKELYLNKVRSLERRSEKFNINNMVYAYIENYNKLIKKD